jgi:hypothetical protein
MLLKPFLRPKSNQTPNQYTRVGLLHYQWSRDPSALQDPINKAIAGIVNVLLWSSSAWYVKHGIKDNAWAVGLSAVLQAWGVVQAIL